MRRPELSPLIARFFNALPIRCRPWIVRCDMCFMYTARPCVLHNDEEAEFWTYCPPCATEVSRGKT